MDLYLSMIKVLNNKTVESFYYGIITNLINRQKSFWILKGKIKQDGEMPLEIEYINFANDNQA